MKTLPVIQSPNPPNSLNSSSFSRYVSSHQAARCLLMGLAASQPTKYRDDGALWRSFAEPVITFLATLEEQGIQVLAPSQHRATIEKIIINRLGVQRSVTVGNTYGIRVNVSDPFVDLQLPLSVQRLHCIVEMAGQSLGVLELPVIDGVVSRWVLSDAVAARFAWEIVTHFLGNSHHRKIKRLPKATIWSLFLQDLWGIPNSETSETSETSVKPQRFVSIPSVDLLPTDTVSATYSIEVSDDLVPLQTEAPVTTIMVTVGGAPIGGFSLATPERTLRVANLREAINWNCGFELCRAAVREGVLGYAWQEQRSLRSRLAKAASQRNGVSLSPTFCQTESAAIIWEDLSVNTMGTSASRWAMLPQKAMPLISEVTACSGSSLKKTALLEKTPQKIFRVPAALASTTIKDGFGKAAISCYPDPPITNPGHLASAQSGQGFASYSPNVYTNCLPILMYHHICPFNAADSPRWQLTPEAFEQQLRHLRDSGFRTVTLTDWQQAMITQTPLPGKVVSLTFDDGYLDFYTTAWPLLKQYGFSASVFIITDHVGRQFEGATLMDWYHIKQLQKEGVEFGSHSAQHPVLSALSNTDMVREGLRSRLLLEKKLDTPVQAFCYPYGDSNPIVRHLIGACGYTVGLSLGERCSSFEDDLLHLSRIEIEGTDSLVRFIAKLQR